MNKSTIRELDLHGAGTAQFKTARIITDAIAIAQMLTVTGVEQGKFSTFVKCPVCEDVHEFTHTIDVPVVDGKDDYQAWDGRGDLKTIIFWSETCGHVWELNFGFHKGNTFCWIEVLEEISDS